MPSSKSLPLPELVKTIKSTFANSHTLHLVGGAVRDLLLGRESKDFDFVVAKNAINLGREVANHLGADFYILDAERDAGRVILSSDGNERVILDFVKQKGSSIDDDLMSRDFSINSMAIALDETEALFDPCEGAQDLRDKFLRACTQFSIQDDPIRILRAIRLAAQFDLKIEAATLKSIKENVNLLQESSVERIRDEFMRIIALPKLKKSLQALEIIGALGIVFPELTSLKKMEQSHPHRFTVWQHTLQTVGSLEKILALLDKNYPHEGAKDLFGGLVVLSLGRYRDQISAHLQHEDVQGRPRRSLLLLAALLHDAGKGVTQEIGEDRIRYRKHEAAGSELAKLRLETLRYSRAEIQSIVEIIAAHKRPTKISKLMDVPDNRTIFQYFQDLGENGIDVGLHSLADLMGRHGVELEEKILSERLTIVRALFEAYFEKYESLVNPPLLISGDDIVEALGINPGPIIGKIQQALKEAQAVGEITSKKQALHFAKSYSDE